MKKVKPSKTTLRVNQTFEGETIEMKVRRIMNTGEPIKDGAPLVFTERKDGVRPEYDIRTDRFDIAVEVMDKVHASTVAKRDSKAGGAAAPAEPPSGGEAGDPK